MLLTADFMQCPRRASAELPTVVVRCPLRAALLDGLMKVGLRNRERRQFYAMNILLETKGSDLTMLKARYVKLSIAV